MDKYLDLIVDNKDKFDTYYQTLVSYNEHTNLTAIIEEGEVHIKHFLDSILPIDEIPNNATLVDVGTGAGFPGVPLKVVRPDINLTLVDSLNKRVVFLNELCSKLDLKARIYHSRAEDFCKANRERFDIATARAVARLNTLVEYLLPLTKLGGKVIVYKGSNYEEELTEAQNAINILGGRVDKTLHFTLPNDAGERYIIIIDKVKPTPAKYPRGKNEPKLKPII